MKNSTKMSIPVIPTKTILLMFNEAEDKQSSNRMHAQNSRFRRPGTRITFNRQQLSYPSGDFFMHWKLWSLWTQRKMLAVTEGRDALPRPAVHSRLTWKSASAEPNCRRTLRWSLTCSMLAWAAPSEQEAGHTEQKHHVSVEGLDTQSKNIMCQWRGWTHRAKTSCVSGGAGHTEQKHHVSVEGLDTQSKNITCQWRGWTHRAKVDTQSKNIMCHMQQKHPVSLDRVDTQSKTCQWRRWTHAAKTSCVTGGGGDTAKTSCVSGGGGDTAKTSCVSGGGGDTAKTSCVTGGGGDTAKTSCVTGGGGDSKNIMCHWRGWRHSKNIMCHWRHWHTAKNIMTDWTEKVLRLK